MIYDNQNEMKYEGRYRKTNREMIYRMIVLKDSQGLFRTLTFHNPKF